MEKCLLCKWKKKEVAACGITLQLCEICTHTGQLLWRARQNTLPKLPRMKPAFYRVRDHQIRLQTPRGTGNLCFPSLAFLWSVQGKALRLTVTLIRGTRGQGVGEGEAEDVTDCVDCADCAIMKLNGHLAVSLLLTSTGHQGMKGAGEKSGI